MAATLKRLRTRADQHRSSRADQLRQLLLDLGPDLPELEVSGIIAAIDQLAPDPQNDWPFIMVSAAQLDAVVSWLTSHSHAPLVAVRVWTKLFTAIRWDTGEIALRRDELAELVGTSSTTVSRIMGELESIGAISRKRHKVEGMRGPGLVRYFLNPMVGTHLSGPARARAQAQAPEIRTQAPPSGRKARAKLQVVDGGQA